MDVIVMAGGRGTRLWPLTATDPKPLVPIANRPVLAHVFDLLSRHGLRRAALTLGYKAESITRAYGSDNPWGHEIRAVYEDEPLGTAGGVRNALSELDPTGPILVLSGDALTDMDLGALLRFHHARGAMVTMALAQVDDPSRYGVVETAASGRIQRFVEKPLGPIDTNTVNTGIYVLDPAVMHHIPASGPYDFGRDLFPALLAAGLPMYGWTNTSYWCDVGTLESYIQANIDAAGGRVGVHLDGQPMAPNLYVEPPADAAPDIHFTPPVLIGRGSRIGRGTRLEEVIVGRHARIGEGCRLKRVVVLAGAEVAAQTVLSDAIVGPFGPVRPESAAEPTILTTSAPA